MSCDGNTHHGVPPPTSKAKPSPTVEKLDDLVHPGVIASHVPRPKSLLARAVSHYLRTKSLSARAIGLRAKDPCSACAAPDRNIVDYHELYPKFLSQVDVSSDVFGESDLLWETASDVSKYMVHETSITTDSEYHSPHPTVPAHLDVSSGTMVPGSVNKVPCPFPKGEALVHLLVRQTRSYP